MKVIVVGAGISGLASAWGLVRAGHEVVVLERAATIPNPLSASGDQHRIIRRAYGGADGYARLIGEAFEAWETLWSEIGGCHLAPVGVLCVSRWEDDEGDLYRQGLVRNGTPHETLHAAEAAARWPFLDPDHVLHATFTSEGGVLFPLRIAAGILARLEAAGARVVADAEVVAIDTARAAVRLADGTMIEADRVLVTAGAWTTRLFPELGRALSPYRTYVTYLEPPEDLRAAWERAPAILSVGGDIGGYVLPPVDGTSLKLGASFVKRPTDDPDANRVATPAEGVRLRDAFGPPFTRIAEYRIRESVTCAYTFTEDERFFCAQEGRALVVSACSGHAYKFGAAIGLRVASALESGDVEGLGRWLRAEAA